MGSASRRCRSATAATLGGNVANGSPIGDSMPALIALGATRRAAQRRRATRELPLEDFYLALPEDGAASRGEFVASIRVPRARRRARAARVQDQQALRPGHLRGVRVLRARRRRRRAIASARIGCGGVAATPDARRATEARARRAQPWNDATAERAARALASEFTPIDDMRASAALPARACSATCCAAAGSRPAARARADARRAVARARSSRSDERAAPACRLDAIATASSARRCRTIRRRCTSPAKRAYTDDLPEPRGTLHAASASARSRTDDLRGIDLAAVRAAPGVVAVITAADIPGVNDVGPIQHDDPILAERVVEFAGQPVFAVAATSVERGARARRSSRKFDIEPLPAILTIDDAMAAQSYVLPPVHVTRGDAARALRRAPHRLRGTRARAAARTTSISKARSRSRSRASTAACRSTCRRSIRARCSTWSRTRSASPRTTSSSNAGAWAAASAARKRRCRCSPASRRCSRARPGAPVKLRLDRDDDMRSTGKRHAFAVRLRRRLRRRRPHPRRSTSRSRRAAASRPTCPGRSTTAPCSTPTTRTGCPTSRSTRYRCKTQHGVRHGVSRLRRTAGHVRDRDVIDEIARALGRDPLDVRKAQPLRHDRAQRHAVRHDGRGQHRAAS